jgi:hypothetical protein
LSEYRSWFIGKEDKKVKITKKLFQIRASKYLPEFKERHNPLVDGVQKFVRSVFVRCKMREVELDYDDYDY